MKNSEHNGVMTNSVSCTVPARKNDSTQNALTMLIFVADDGVGKPERGTTTSGGKDATVDVNGNPVPPKTSNNVGSKATTPQRSTFPCQNDLKDLADDLIDDHSSRDRDMPSASDSNSDKKSRRKKKEDGFQTAEKLYTNNCGNKTVDDLLEYIESDNSVKRKKDKNKVNHTVVPNVTSDKPVSKKPKKGRSSSLTENHKDSENGSDKADDSTSKVSDASDIKDANSEALSEIGSVELNHKLPSMAPQYYNHDDEPMPEVFPFDINSSNYKFTDKEPLSLNDTGFTEVRKKKKLRTPGAPSSNHEPFHASHESYNHRHTTPIRSITPPPKSSSRQEKHERAFSPSGFPELGGSGRPREGRRNSTGNVPCVTSLDDSDLESVKSLPAGTSNDLVLAGPLVSYAKIAAKPKQTGSSAGAGSKPATEEYKAPAAEEPQMASPELPAPTHTVTQSPQLPSLNDFPAPTVSCDPSSRSISTPKAPKVSSTGEKEFDCKDSLVTNTDCKGCVTDSREVTPTPVLCTNIGIFPYDNKFSLEFVGESHIELGEECSLPHSGNASSRSCSAGSDEPSYSTAQLDAMPGATDASPVSSNLEHSNKSAENNHKKKSTECSVIFMDVLAQSGLFAPVQKIDITFGFDDPCDVCNLPPCMEPAVYDKLQTVTKLNGLVLPAGSLSSPELTFLGPETNLDQGNPVSDARGEVAAPSPPMPASSPSSSYTNMAAEHCLAKPVTSNVPARHDDLNYDCGKFMLEDAVYFIRRG